MCIVGAHQLTAELSTNALTWTGEFDFLLALVRVGTGPRVTRGLTAVPTIIILRTLIATALQQFLVRLRGGPLRTPDVRLIQATMTLQPQHVLARRTHACVTRPRARVLAAFRPCKLARSLANLTIRTSHIFIAASFHCMTHLRARMIATRQLPST